MMLEELYLLLNTPIVKINKIKKEAEKYNDLSSKEQKITVLKNIYLGYYYQILVTNGLD